MHTLLPFVVLHRPCQHGHLLGVFREFIHPRALVVVPGRSGRGHEGLCNGWHVIQELWRIGLLSSVQLAKEVKVLRVDLWWGKAVGIIVNVNGAE